jgi:hypothetical protein
MKVLFQITIILLAIICIGYPSFSDSNTINVNLEVGEGSCGDGICQTEWGENVINCPQDCTSDAYRDIIAPEIFNLTIKNITLNSAEIYWETNEPAICKVYLGETAEYNKELISGDAFKKKHSTLFDDLLPGTTYHFKIVCSDMNLNENEREDQAFKTLQLPDITPPVNVSNFRAVAGENKVELSWENPTDSDFKAVRIVRSKRFYISDPWEGIPIYNNDGNTFTDKDVENGVRYYYTAFAYDKSGNYSSGATVSVVPRKSTDPAGPPDEPSIKPPDKPAIPEIEKIKIEDFLFTQGTKKLSLKENTTIEVSGKEPITISIDYGILPEVLKTILVTLEKDDASFSFLLRVNKTKDAYEATFLPPEDPEEYKLTITILDYKNQAMKEIKANLTVTEALKEKTDESSAGYLLYYIFLIIILIILYFLIRKRKIL